jgi:hydroxyacylglutathione hydrolase
MLKSLLKVIVGMLLLAAAGGFGLWFLFFANLSALADGGPADGVRVVKDGFVSVGLLDAGDKQVALVDCGADTSGKAVLAELSKRGLTSDAVVAIFLTHGHADHTAGCHLFTRAKIYALAPDVALAEGREGSHGPLTRFAPFKPTGFHVTQALHDGDAIDVGKLKVRVLAVPGHTSGSAAYLGAGCLFLGDSANITSSGELVAAPWPFTDDSPRNQTALKELAGKLRADSDKIVAVVPAHSGMGYFSALTRYTP